MKHKLLLIIFVVLTLSLGVLPGENVQDVLDKANELQQSGETEAAIALLEKEYEKSPKNVSVCATLGFYKGMMAGKTQDFMAAGKWVGEAFTLLNKAVDLDENAYLPRFYRGILSVNTPEFLGKLDNGITDLERFVTFAKDPARKVPSSIVPIGIQHLASGYEKKHLLEKAVETYEKAASLMTRDEKKKRILTTIENLKAKIAAEAKKSESTAEKQAKSEMDKKIAEPDNALALSKKLIQEKKFKQARKLLEALIEKEPKNLPAYKLLVNVVSEMASQGYDEHIYTDTNYRTNLAFEIVRLTEKICELDPEDMSMRLTKGAIAVEMPFFVNKLDQGIADLKMVLEGGSTDEQKAQALYYLGVAHQKIKTTYWIKVAKKYGKTKAAKSVFAGLMPTIKRVSQEEFPPPCLKIDFILGFRDELAPQTAVWIEGPDGEFVKTIYVSGFCGYAKEKQIDLPQWGKNSEFRDVDGVTSASIDQGHHVYIWDLKDFQGKKVADGEYRIRVETHFWPSMMYQRADVYVQIGSTADSAIHEKGNLIPFLKVDFHPGK